MSIGEIERGIELQRAKDLALAEALTIWLDKLLSLYSDRILAVDLPVSRRWGRLSAAVGNNDADLLIAATALEHGLTVITQNTRHFKPTGVPLLNLFED